MSENQLTVTSLGDAVREKVRKAMFDSIPDEAIGTMIAGEFDSFFKDKRDSYNGRLITSPFTDLVKREIENHFKERVRDIVKKQVDELTKNWDTNSNTMLGAMIEEMAPHAMVGMSKMIAQECINRLKNNGY
jgi:hypothetical protein